MAMRLSLAEQIARLEEPTPVDYDPEDLRPHDQDDDAEGLNDALDARAHYLEVGPSSLRKKLHDSVADPKYEGVRTSRKQLMEDSGSEESEEGLSDEEQPDDSDDEELPSNKNAYTRPNEISHLPDSHDSSESESGAESKHEHWHSERPTLESDTPADVASVLKKAREEDLRKGQAVKKQIAVWDTLLDTRIRLQKSVVAANQLPPPNKIQEYLSEPQCQESVKRFLHESALLAEELFEFQEELLTAINTVTPPSRKRRKVDSDASVEDYATFFTDAAADNANLEQALHPYLIQTLSKWSSKIQAVAPNVLLPSNKGAFAKGNVQAKSAVQLIEEALSDHTKLLARTQASRGKRDRIGISTQDPGEADLLDPEIFDDTDFYQKMLRDVIEARGNSTGGDDWMMIQKQKKAKKKVDTKASKGRKLRYEVHEKIQNFMVPVPNPGAWHDEQVDELFASILGKGFESAPADVDEPVTEPSVELDGFRVFG